MAYSAEFYGVDRHFDESIPRIDINQFADKHRLSEKVAIHKDDHLFLVLNVYSEVDKDGCLCEQCFKKILIGEQKIAILHGRHVHLFDIETHCVNSVFLNDYVGDLYPVPDVYSETLSDDFLVTSFTYTFLVNIHTGIVWQSGDCAIDGVNIYGIKEGVIYGSGDWDPPFPEGWRDFTLSLNDGSFIDSSPCYACIS
ncbi:hypothetical protein WDV76_12245 [Xenorhabdus griffiniae]|uniref:hypothetical protein n=1 Tax=Xenorhabdus griffiniae TaxID=351672 RepID=UPI0030D35B99